VAKRRKRRRLGKFSSLSNSLDSKKTKKIKTFVIGKKDKYLGYFYTSSLIKNKDLRISFCKVVIKPFNSKSDNTSSQNEEIELQHVIGDKDIEVKGISMFKEQYIKFIIDLNKLPKNEKVFIINFTAGLKNGTCHTFDIKVKLSKDTPNKNKK